MKTKTTALWLVTSVLVSPAAFAAAEVSRSPATKKEEKTLEAATQLENAEKLLAQMRTRYRDDHPRVKEQLRKVAELERELAPKMKDGSNRVPGSSKLPGPTPTCVRHAELGLDPGAVP